MKKVSQCRRKLKGPFSLARYCMLRGEKRKAFLVQFPCQIVWIEKSHYNSRVFLQEAPTNETISYLRIDDTEYRSLMDKKDFTGIDCKHEHSVLHFTMNRYYYYYYHYYYYPVLFLFCSE